MSEKRASNRFKHVRVDNGQDRSFTVRGWNAENSRREREAQLAASAGLSDPETNDGEVVGTRPISKREAIKMGLVAVTTVAALAILGPSELGGHDAHSNQREDQAGPVVDIPQLPNIDHSPK